MPKLGFRFDAGLFARKWIVTKAEDWLADFFAIMPKDVLTSAIILDKNLLVYIPPQKLAQYKAQVKPFAEVQGIFTDEEVYSWIPESTRMFIESTPQGKSWAFKQIASVRDFIAS